jgi:glutamyl-tRNA reductase
MEIGIIGTSVWQQNMPLLEKLTLDRDKKNDILIEIKTLLDLDELIYLATCNRVEFIYVTSRPNSGARFMHRLLDFFFSERRDISFFPNDFYHFEGKEAIIHLFRTASSLESLVLGENQITGQIKQAYQDASEAGLVGPALDSLIQEALNVARKVKSQTSLGEGSLSMASLAGNELSAGLGSVENPMVALIGSGKMQVKMAKFVRESLGGRLLFVNRTFSKAEDLADEFGGRAMPLDEFLQSPPAVNAIVSATASVEPIFGGDFLDRLPGDSRRVVCVDLAVPRDFCLDFIDDDRVILVDIPALKAKSQGSLRQKFVEAGKANEIVRNAVSKYLSNQIEVSLKPIFSDAYRETLETAEKALGDLFAKRVTSLPKEDQEAVLRVVTKLIGQSTFGPVRRLSQQLVEKGQELHLPDAATGFRQAV